MNCSESSMTKSQGPPTKAHALKRLQAETAAELDVLLDHAFKGEL